MRLKNKTVLITGAGSGIGKSTALLFAKEAAQVIVNDIHIEKGTETVQEIREASGESYFIQADVTDPESVQTMVDKALG